MTRDEEIMEVVDCQKEMKKLWRWLMSKKDEIMEVVDVKKR